MKAHWIWWLQETIGPRDGLYHLCRDDSCRVGSVPTAACGVEIRHPHVACAPPEEHECCPACAETRRGSVVEETAGPRRAQ
jgi:hypothetical protein